MANTIKKIKSSTYDYILLNADVNDLIDEIDENNNLNYVRSMGVSSFSISEHITFKVYPIPFKDKIHIDFSSKEEDNSGVIETDWEIFFIDVKSNKIKFSSRIKEGESVIDTTLLKKGQYLLVILINNQEYEAILVYRE